MPLAQLDRVSDYESEGREFESLRARHFRKFYFFALKFIFVDLFSKRDVAQLGRAPGLGPGGRRFESCHPDHKVARRRRLSLCGCTDEVDSRS